MRSVVFLALAICAWTSLLAAPARALSPAVNPQIMEMMKNQADTVRSRDKATGAEIEKRPDPVEGLTCLDQQLKLTADLGKIFSDKKVSVPTGISGGFCMSPSVNSAPQSLSKSLSTVVVPSLGAMLQNFLGSLSGLLGGFDISGFVANLNFQQCTPTFELPAITLPTFHLPGNLGACLSLSVGGQTPFSGAELPVRCVGYTPPSFSPCDRIKKLWKGGPASVEGAGPRNGAPYTDFKGLFKKGLKGARDYDVRQNVTEAVDHYKQQHQAVYDQMVAKYDAVKDTIKDPEERRRRLDQIKAKMDQAEVSFRTALDNQATEYENILKDQADDYTQNATAEGNDFKKQLNNNKVYLKKKMDDTMKLSGPGAIDSWPVSPDIPPECGSDEIIDMM